MKEGILQEFVARCKRYEDEIAMEENLINKELWQYPKYILMKEGLAIFLEQFGLHENALTILKELKNFITLHPETSML